jgi:FkbM family methyltransferase
VSTENLDELEKRGIRDFFQSRSAGYFIEIGANDPQNGSQTWQLEQLGWTGLLVEPMQMHYDKLVSARPRSRVVRAACSSPEKRGTGTLHLAQHNGFNTLEKNVDDQGVQYLNSETVRLVALDDLLNEQPPKRVDFLSIDVEGTELDVLKGFDLARWQPELLLIEDKVNNLHKHLYLKRHGYRLLRRTALNSWYVPKAHPARATFPESLRLVRKYYLGLPFRKFRHSQRVRRRLAKA